MEPGLQDASTARRLLASPAADPAARAGGRALLTNPTLTSPMDLVIDTSALIVRSPAYVLGDLTAAANLSVASTSYLQNGAVISASAGRCRGASGMVV
jgi:hypothetical protein